jgi:hypothetical protein
LGGIPAHSLEIPDVLLLLGVHADHELPRGALRLGDRIDVPELRVAIEVLGSLLGLRVRLQAVPQRPKQLRHRREMDIVPHLPQRRREITNALRRPAQQRLRVTPTALIDQPLDVPQQRHVDLNKRLAATPRPPYPSPIKRLTGLKLSDPLTNRVNRDPSRPRGSRDPAPPRRPRLRRRVQPTLPLVQLTPYRPESFTDPMLIDHTPIVLHE